MNQPDPLAQLRDIHLPDPVSGWPPGPGWWAVACLVFLMVIALAYWLWHRHRANAWRRQAVRELNNALLRWQEQPDTIACLQHISATLKRTALRQFPNYDVARLNGEDWAAFLDRQWRKRPEQSFSSLGFAEQAYRPQPADVDMKALHALSLRWLRQLEAQPC